MKRKVMGVLCYLLGVVLFVIANSAVVSGSPIQLSYFQRAALCGAAVCSNGIAPFLCPSKTRAGTVIKFGIALVLICCMFAFGGFKPNDMA